MLAYVLNTRHVFRMELLTWLRPSLLDAVSYNVKSLVVFQAVVYKARMLWVPLLLFTNVFLCMLTNQHTLRSSIRFVDLLISSWNCIHATGQYYWKQRSFVVQFTFPSHIEKCRCPQQDNRTWIVICFPYYHILNNNSFYGSIFVCNCRFVKVQSYQWVLYLII